MGGKATRPTVPNGVGMPMPPIGVGSPAPPREVAAVALPRGVAADGGVTVASGTGMLLVPEGEASLSTRPVDASQQLKEIVSVQSNVLSLIRAVGGLSKHHTQACKGICGELRHGLVTDQEQNVRVTAWGLVGPQQPHVLWGFCFLFVCSWQQ